MKQKKILGISLVMALFLIVSTFSVGTLADAEENLIVSKKVWDENHWAEQVEADLDEIVTFNISVVYYKVDLTDGYEAANLVVIDTLPGCLDYVEDSAEIFYGNEVFAGQSQVNGKEIVWNLSDEWEITLREEHEEIPQTVYIEFDAVVVAYTDEAGECNSVVVTGTEHCSNEDLYGSSQAAVIALEPENPEMIITKEVWDLEEGVWTKNAIVAYDSDMVFFRINVTNTGNVDLNDVVVKDVLPSFLLYDDSSCTPTYQSEELIEWGPFNLCVGNSMVWTVDTTVFVDGVQTGQNYVNATACEIDEAVEDVVTVTGKQHLDVDKKVKVGYKEGWLDELEYIRKDSTALFKITTTYHGDGFVDCGVVGDFLPNKFEYLDTTEVVVAGEVKTPGEDDYPNIIVGADSIIEYCDCEQYDITTIVENYDSEFGTLILWDFNVPDFDLTDGDSVVIEFTTYLDDYCQYCGCDDCCVLTNAACAIMGGCCANVFTDCDKVDITCCPPPSTFTKEVKDGDEWVEDIVTYTGKTLDFKLKLNYYGSENLTEIQFVDLLPCTLEYVEDSSIMFVTQGNEGMAGNFEPEISEDGQSIWWTLAEYPDFENFELIDGGIITITFQTLVTKASMNCCNGCEECCQNIAWVYGKQGCTEEPNFERTDSVYIISHLNHKPETPDIDGPASGKINETLTFKTKIHDEDGDQVYYKIRIVQRGVDTDLSIGSVDWIGPYESDEEIEFTHTFGTEGTYEVAVRAKDAHDAESSWTEFPLEVDITQGDEPEPDLGICITTKIGFGKVNACLTNNADCEMSDIDWEINAKGGILGRINVTNNGTIETLEDESKNCISTLGGGKIKFGIGRLTVTVKATVDEKTFTKEASGFVIGRLVILL